MIKFISLSSIKMKDNLYTLAHQEALKSPMDKKYGAVLVWRNKVVSKGFNHYSTHSSGVKDSILRA